MYIENKQNKYKWNSNVLIWFLIILLFIMTFIFNKFGINNIINIHIIISSYWFLAAIFSLFDSRRLFRKWKNVDEESFMSNSDYELKVNYYQTFSFSSFNNGLISLIASYLTFILYSFYLNKYTNIIIFTLILWFLLYLYLHIAFSYVFVFKNNYKRDVLHYLKVSLFTIIFVAILIFIYSNIIKNNEMYEKIISMNIFLKISDFKEINILVINAIIITLGIGKIIEIIFKIIDKILSKKDYM